MNPEQPEAIQPDATAEQANTQAEYQPGDSEQVAATPRQEMMNHIIEQREQSQDEPGISSQTDGETISVKVDGVEQQIPIDQARATLQKNMAADKRLNDAVLKQRELQQWEQRLQQQEQQLQQPPVAHSDTTERLQAAVDALYDGETDNAVKALSEVIGRNNNATLNTDQISQQASEKVMRTLAKQKFDTDVSEANQQFHKDFSDIATDPTLMNMADQKTIELMTQHQDWSPIQITTEAGRQTRDWVQNLTGQRSPSRAERKQSLQSMPRSSGSVAYQPPAKNDGPKSPQDVISAMRQSRGQA